MSMQSLSRNSSKSSSNSYSAVRRDCSMCQWSSKIMCNLSACKEVALQIPSNQSKESSCLILLSCQFLATKMHLSTTFTQPKLIGRTGHLIQESNSMVSLGRIATYSRLCSWVSPATSRHHSLRNRRLLRKTLAGSMQSNEQQLTPTRESARYASNWSDPTTSYVECASWMIMETPCSS